MPEKTKPKRPLNVVDLPDLTGEEMPPVKDYLKARQKNGRDLHAEEVFRETWQWLKERGCEKAVNTQLLEQYAMMVSRWIQCEECISEYGFLAKHPTTGNAVTSPYVTISQQYRKAAGQAWSQIFQAVKESGAEVRDESASQDEVMDRFFRLREG